MFCSKCGNQLSDDAEFCKQCGEVVKKNSQSQIMKKKSDRSRKKIVIAVTALLVSICIICISVVQVTNIPKQVDIWGQYINKLIVIKSDGKYGLMDYAGNFVEPCIYDEITDLEKKPQGKRGNYWIDLTASREIDEYKYVADSIAVYQGQEKGISFVAYIGGDKFFFENEVPDSRKLMELQDSKMNALSVVKYNYFKYECVHDGNGLFPVAKEDSEGNAKWGYIDSKGEEVIPLVYDSASFFREGLAVVAKEDSEGNAKRGYIDSKGEEVIPLIYDNTVGGFQEGIAAVTKEDSEGNRNWGYINKEGEEVIPFVYSNIGIEGFQEGIAAVAKEDSEGNAKWGYINKEGVEVIPFVYDEAEGFQEGLAAVVKEDSEGNAKWGYINNKGEEVIPFVYDEAEGFQEGLAAVAKGIGEGNIKWGYVNSKGEEVTPLVYDLATDFQKGLAVVAKEGSEENIKWGFIDSNGEEVISCIFDALCLGSAIFEDYIYHYYCDNEPYYFSMMTREGDDEKNCITNYIVCNWPIISEDENTEYIGCLRQAKLDKNKRCIAIANPKGDIIVEMNTELDKCNQYYEKAITNYEKGETEKAIKFLKKAKELQPSNPYFEQLLEEWR